MWWTKKIDRADLILIKLDQILLAQNLALQQGGKIVLDLTKLTQEVNEMSDTVASAVTVLNKVAEEMRANAGNEAAINALADKIDADAAALGAAIAAGPPTE